MHTRSPIALVAAAALLTSAAPPPPQSAFTPRTPPERSPVRCRAGVADDAPMPATSWSPAAKSVAASPAHHPPRRRPHQW